MIGIHSAGLALTSVRKDSPPALEEDLSKHASVYSEGLGRMKNIQAWIHLEGGCWPPFSKAHLIALGLKPVVDEALKESI